jgi:hypothetical protein
MKNGPGGEGDQGRMVDISEGQVTGAGNVVQLIAKDSIPAGSEEMKQHGEGREHAHDNRRRAVCGPDGGQTPLRIHKRMYALAGESVPSTDRDQRRYFVSSRMTTMEYAGSV